MNDLDVFRAIMFLRAATKLSEIEHVHEAELFLRDNGIENVDVKLDHLAAFDGEGWVWTVTVGSTVPDKIEFSWMVVT